MPVMHRCLKPGTYFLNVYPYGGNVNNDYALLIEEEKDPAVVADAGKDICAKPVRKKAEVRLDGESTHTYAYSEEQGSAPFIDITSSGVEIVPKYWRYKVLMLPEDFRFDFFGSARKQVAVSSEGFLAFGTSWAASWDFAMPSPEEPNDILAALWTASWGRRGQGYYEYRDVNGDSKLDLVVEWHDFRASWSIDPLTFEAILYNGGNRIELRYDAVSPCVSMCGIGLENCTGSGGFRHQGEPYDGESLTYSWVPVPLPEESTSHYSLVVKPGPVLDISQGGTKIPLVDDDSSEIAFPPGFAFSFYGNAESKLLVSSNGYLTFGGIGKDNSPDAVPDPRDPNSVIAPFWKDLDPGTAGTVLYEFQDVDQDSNVDLVILWKGVKEKAGNGLHTVEAILYGFTGRIEFRYGTDEPANDTGDVAIGVENDKGTEGVYWTKPILTGTCLEFKPYAISNYQWYENGKLIATGVKPTVQLEKGCHRIELNAFGTGDCSIPMGKDKVMVYVGDSKGKCAKCFSDEDEDEDADRTLDEDAD
jgi:hypothetical protein